MDLLRQDATLLWTAARLGCLPSDAPHKELISDLRLGRSKPAQRPDVLPSEIAGCTRGCDNQGTSAGGAGGMAFTTVTVTSGRVAPVAWTAFLMAASAAALSKCAGGGDQDAEIVVVLADLPSCDVEQIECLVEADGMHSNQTAGLPGQRQDVVVAHLHGIEESEGQTARTGFRGKA